MRPAAAIVAGLLSFRAAADCTPADPKVIAAAERKASDADRKAQQAESVAVRSGNPGAQARASRARAEANAAQEELAKLQCKTTGRSPATHEPELPAPGY